jgi:DNA-binding response OmpR family regulator
MVIMLVEDEVHVQFFIWKLLKADGFTVLTAGSAEAALEISSNHPGPVDLLLTDLEMARMDGLELCERIVAERHAIKMLLMSGDLRAKEEASKRGIPFLEKPFTTTTLREAIQAALEPIRQWR